MTRPSRILLVDDEVAIQRAVAPLLRSRGYEVDVVGTGREAVDAVTERSPDLVVLDLGLPDLEGIEVCRRIRKASKAPIVVLSARGGEADKVAALDIGADDYVTKPFGSEELLARIRVALRRVDDAEGPDVERITVADLVIDFNRRRVLRGDEEIRLTPKEFELLALLAAQRGPRADPSHHSENDLGRERRRAARAPLGADGAASQEDRARSRQSTVSAQRTVRGLSTGEHAGPSLAHF